MIQPDAQSWFWIGALGMLLGSIYLFVQSLHMRAEDRLHGVLQLLVTLLAATAYFGLATNRLLLVRLDGVLVHLPRYLEWAVTGPLMLANLALIALPTAKTSALQRTHGMLVLSLVSAGFYTVLTALAASVTIDPLERSAWFAMSVMGFLAVAWVLLGPVRRQSRIEGQGLHTARAAGLAGALMTLWGLSLFTGALGPLGASAWGPDWGAMIVTILDLSTKVGFGIITLRVVHQLARKAAPVPGVSAVDAAAGHMPGLRYATQPE